MELRSEDTVGYWLFYAQRTTAYAFYEALKACCLMHSKPYVITPPQWNVLSLLHECDGITIGSVSQKRGFDPPTITGIVKRLEANDLVQRIHDREDRRQVKLYLTNEGRDLMQFLPDAATSFNEILVQGFSEAEQHDLVIKLQQLVVNLSSVGPGTGDRFGLLPDFLRQDVQEEM